MIPREELLPEFVRFSNVHYRLANGWAASTEAVFAQTRLAEYLLELKARLAWELPLLCAFEEGLEVAREVGRHLEALEFQVSGQTASTNLEEGFSSALERFLGVMRSAESLRSELPQFTDVKIINEMMLLTSAHLDGRLDMAPLGQRIPVLVDWVNRKEVDWQTYVRLFPDQQFRVDRVLAAFQAIRSGIGGIYLFLQGEDPEGLQGGLAIVLRALEVLAPAVETRFLTESERVEMSPDLRLERVWRGADWPSWEGTSLAADLLEFYQHWAKPLQGLATATLLPGSIHEETMADLGEIESLFHSSFESLWGQRDLADDQAARPGRAQALADLELCRKETLALLDRVSQRLDGYRALETFALYSNIFGVLSGILREDTPDAYLHQLLIAINEGQIQFQQAVEQTAQALSGPGSGGGGHPTAAAQAAKINSRFDLPTNSQGPELVLDGAFEVVVQPGHQAPGGASPIPEPATSSSDAIEIDDEQASLLLDSAWQALEHQNQAQELLWSYLQEGQTGVLHDAYELFAEPFLTLSDYVPAPPVEDESTLSTCPYCQEVFPGDSDRCPNCKRLITLAERQIEAAETPVASVGSSLLLGLDQKTRALGGGGESGQIAQEWRVLARRLESMAKAAKAENQGPHLELVFAELVAGCHQVADTIASRSEGYRGLRGPLLQKFSLLERMVGVTAGGSS